MTTKRQIIKDLKERLNQHDLACMRLLRNITTLKEALTQIAVETSDSSIRDIASKALDETNSLTQKTERQK